MKLLGLVRLRLIWRQLWHLIRLVARLVVQAEEVMVGNDLPSLARQEVGKQKLSLRRLGSYGNHMLVVELVAYFVVIVVATVAVTLAFNENDRISLLNCLDIQDHEARRQ